MMASLRSLHWTAVALLALCLIALALGAVGAFAQSSVMLSANGWFLVAGIAGFTSAAITLSRKRLK